MWRQVEVVSKLGQIAAALRGNNPALDFNLRLRSLVLSPDKPEFSRLTKSTSRVIPFETLVRNLQEITVKTNALQRQSAEMNEMPSSSRVNQKDLTDPVPPQRANALVVLPQLNEGNHLRMYTEEEVSAMLRVSLSQLRKWRIKRNKGRVGGPPFKKVGRLVRYPARALQAYIDQE